MKNNTNNIQELFTNYPDILSVSQLMELLQIGKVLAYKLIDSKKIKALKIGREYKIIKQSVIDYINGRS
jgi:excisionase family DNA binding protein